MPCLGANRAQLQLLEEDQLDESCGARQGRGYRIRYRVVSHPIPLRSLRLSHEHRPALIRRGFDHQIDCTGINLTIRWWHDDDATRLCWTSLSVGMGAD